MAVRKNLLKVWTLLLGGALGILWLGQELGDRQGLLVGFLIIFCAAVGIFMFSHRWIAGVFSARPLEGQDPWGLLEAVEDLSYSIHLPAPRVMLSEQSSAFVLAFGRGWSDAVIVVSVGFLTRFTIEEQHVAILHQLVRIKNRDIMLKSICSVIGLLVLETAQFLDRIWVPFRLKKSRKHLRLFEMIVQPVLRLLFLFSRNKKETFLMDRQTAHISLSPDLFGKVLWKLFSYHFTDSLAVPKPLGTLFLVTPLTEAKKTPSFDREHHFLDRRIQNLSRMVGI